MPDPQTIPFAAWEPDRSDRFNPTAEAKGVYSSGGQYAPFPDLQQYGGDSEVDAFTTVLLHMDGADLATAFPDDSPTPHTFTAAGNAHTDTAQSKFGGASLLCDGTGDWITTPDVADLSLGALFTIDLWFKINAATGSAEKMAGQADSTLDPTLSAWYIERHTDDTIRAHISNGTAFTTLASTTTFVTGADFAHVALVLSGGTAQLFINGTEEDSAAFAGSVFNSAAALRIGAAGEDTTTPWTGWIDEFRLSVGVARWTAAFTPPTSAYSFGAGAEDVVLGARTAYDDDTTPAIFFGDDDRLYRMVSREAVDVSKAGGYSATQWMFAQFGNNVIAVDGSVAPQHYEMGASTDYADLAGTPPSGLTSVARVNDFVMGGKAFTVHWCAFNDVTDWVPDPGTQAGNQELDQEQGLIISIVGLDYAAIFQERAIRRAIYVGPPLIFDFGQDYVEKARGCIARNAAAPFGRVVYYAADDGFYAFDGQSSVPIGFGKVDDYFVRNLNYAYRHKVCVGIDGLRKLAVFGFPAGSNQFISELLIYSISDGRWTHDLVDLEHLFDTPSEPLTVETIGAALDPAGNLDSGTIDPSSIDSPVFDDRRRRLAGFTTSDHRLRLFSGSARAAIMETAEFEVGAGKRSLVTEIWPMGDMQPANVSASIGYRKALPGAAIAYTNASSMNRAGFCPQRLDARFMRGRVMLGAGANWRRMEGIHAKPTPTGSR